MSTSPVLVSMSSALRRRLKATDFRFETAPAPRSKQLLVDVSMIVRQDARTGIQRVVRALLGQLMARVGPDLTVQPVFASRDHGFCLAHFDVGDGLVTVQRGGGGALYPVAVHPGDVFLGLDLAANILPHVERQIEAWRRRGVSVNFVVYDLLPLFRPEWFQPRTVRNFQRWLGVLGRQADRCLCISAEVAAGVAKALHVREASNLPEITTIPLGADLDATYPNRGLPADIAALREWLKRYRVMLSVGTIEPRKGHDQLLAAMTLLWKSPSNADVAFVIVGRPGWKTEDFQQALCNHPEYGVRLRWLDQASDELLSELYAGVVGLVAASYGEGFGLPLIEALAHDAPVLARDLPVFREIGGAMLDYFDDDAPEPLAARLQSWLAATRRPTAEAVAALPRWADSAAALANCIGLPLANDHGTTRA